MNNLKDFARAKYRRLRPRGEQTTTDRRGLDRPQVPQACLTDSYHLESESPEALFESPRRVLTIWVKPIPQPVELNDRGLVEKECPVSESLHNLQGSARRESSIQAKPKLQQGPSESQCPESGFPERDCNSSSGESNLLANLFVQNKYHADQSSPMYLMERDAFQDCVEKLLYQGADPNMTICIYEVGKRVFHRILGTQCDDDAVKGIIGGLGDGESTLYDETALKPFEGTRLKAILTPFLECIVLGDIHMIAPFLHCGVDAQSLIRHFTVKTLPDSQKHQALLLASRRFLLVRATFTNDEIWRHAPLKRWLVRYVLETLGIIDDVLDASYGGQKLLSTTLKEKVDKAKVDKAKVDKARWPSAAQLCCQLMRPAAFGSLWVKQLLQQMPEVEIAVALDDADILMSTLKSDQTEQDTPSLHVTATHVALASSSSRMWSQLLHLGVDVNIRDCFGIAPLQEAIYWGDLDAIQMLLDAGADLYPHDDNSYNDNKNVHRTSHRHIDSFVGRKKIETQGLNLKHKDSKGRTLLDLAIKRARFDIITKLLDLDVPFDSTSILAAILLERAVMERRGHTIDRLQSHGVKRLPFVLHSPACMVKEMCDDRIECLINSSFPPSWPLGCTWQWSRKMPIPQCSHVRKRITEVSQTRLTAPAASALAMCNMCQLVDAHRRHIAPYSIQPDSTLSLYLRRVRETQRWEMISHISGSSALKHTVVSVPLELYRVIEKMSSSEDRHTNPYCATTMRQYWLNNCAKNHISCQANDLTYIPTRLVEILAEGFVRIVDNLSFPQMYVALSHRWSGDEASKTTSLNIAERLSPFQADHLSLTLRDCIGVAQRLGYRYLWIDVLCIIQDSELDWLHEAAEMRHVYSNAMITVAAECTSAETAGEGITRSFEMQERAPFPFRELEKFSGKEIESLLQHAGKSEDKRLCILPNVGREHDSNRPKGVLDTRGWILQEQLLSPRILYYGRSQLYWDCISQSASEIYPMGVSLLDDIHSGETWAFRLLRRTITGKGDPGMLVRLIADVWIHVVQNYSARALTKQSDKLIALQGVITALKSVLQLSSVAGMWEQDLWKQLTWWVARPAITTAPGTPFPAPTWSWLSVDGAVSHHRSMRINKDPVQLDDLAPLPDLRCTITNIHAEPTSVSALLDLSATSFSYMLTANDLKEMAWKRGHPGKLNLATARWMLDRETELPLELQCVIIAEDEVAKMTVGMCLAVDDFQPETWKRVGVFLWEGLTWQIAKYAGKELQTGHFAVI